MTNLLLPLAFAAHPIVHLNAALNSLAAVLLVVGLVMIKRGHVMAHKRTMLSAFGVSAVFLCCYLWYHVVILQGKHVGFTNPSPVRYLYYAILASHILLAFSVPVLAIWTIYLGLRATGCCQQAREMPTPESVRQMAGYRLRHMRLARWTYPIWLYVSVTGVVVYVMLYHLWPPVGQ
jgi:putative membrane protein